MQTGADIGSRDGGGSWRDGIRPPCPAPPTPATRIGPARPWPGPLGSAAVDLHDDGLGLGEELAREVPALAADPESPTPPNGVRRSRMKKQLTHTVPARSFDATRCARERFSVKSIALRP